VSTFGDRLKKLRQKHGMTQQDLAGLFHISASAISSYETGARIPDIIFLNELAKYYNVSTDFMLGLSNNTLSFDVLNQTIIDNIVNDMLEENKDKLELREELKFTRYPNAPENTRKSYMSYKAITSKTSRQYKMQQIAYTSTHGIRQVNGRYCVALGSAYAKTIGTYVDIILENGEVIPCILADQKQDIHTDATNRVCFDGSLVEFVVDMDYIINKVRTTGDVSNVCEEWKPQVEEVIVYEKVEEF